MEFSSVVALGGPNIWTRGTVLEARIPADKLRALAALADADCRGQLVRWLPSLAYHAAMHGRQGECACGRGSSVPCVQLARILGCVAAELQSLSGTPVRFSCAESDAAGETYTIAVEYEEEVLGRACLSGAWDLCFAAAGGRAVDVPAELARLRGVAREVCFGPNTGPIAAAARARGIPVRRLNNVSLVQLGHGARQHRIQTAVTDRAGMIAEWISGDKELTKSLLRDAGVAVPDGRRVTTAEAAWTAACELGVPVVVKPRTSDYGRGVSLNLKTEQQVLAAYAAARVYGEEVLVERFIEGFHHRLLVVGGRVVAAVRREPAQVVGDGCRSIGQLIDEANKDPRRGLLPTDLWDKLALSEAALAILAEQGCDADSILPPGQAASFSQDMSWTSGTNTDVTDEVHPDVAAECIEAARVIGLDLAGVDVVAHDIRRPLEEQGGAVLEINAEPAILVHRPPLSDRTRLVGKAIVDSLFPHGESGRIPLVAVTGSGDNGATARLLAHFVAANSQTVGVACSSGTFISGRQLRRGDCGNAAAARAILLHPAVEAAVLETSPESVLGDGLGFDLCQVAIVMPGTVGSLQCCEADDGLSRRTRAVRAVVESVARSGCVVLDADDPRADELVSACRGRVIYCSPISHHPLIAYHRRIGGRAAFVRNGTIIVARGEVEKPILRLSDLPRTSQSSKAQAIAAALAATAAAWALRIPGRLIRRAAQSTSRDPAPTLNRENSSRRPPRRPRRLAR